METPRGVIAGLDPAIHHFSKKMDARIKSRMTTAESVKSGKPLGAALSPPQAGERTTIASVDYAVI
jgi:hypothetical protein